jgi:hypothetical protein
MASIAYRTAEWFFSVFALLLVPPVLGAFAYSFWLHPQLSAPIFSKEHAASLPFALAVLLAHAILLWFSYGVCHVGCHCKILT